MKTSRRSPQFYRAKKLKSPPPPFQEMDEISEYDSPPPATLHTARKRARPPSDIVCETPAKKTPYVIDLRSPERMPRPSATAEQIDPLVEELQIPRRVLVSAFCDALVELL